MIPLLRDDAATYTAEELADLLKLHPKTVLKRLRAGTIHALPRTGKTEGYRIARDEVYRLIGVAAMEQPAPYAGPADRRDRLERANERLRRLGVAV